MKLRFRLGLGFMVIIAIMISSCGVHTDQFPRDIDPSRQTELNGK